MNDTNLTIKNLHLSFGATEVLKGINLDIKQGEFFSFLGSSGSGKSTLLRAIAGFGPTPKGQILIGGQDIADLPPWEREVGMVFQSYALWPHMTVAKNVAFGLEERKVAKAEVNKRVIEALDMVGLADYADRRPSQLSGGQQQRVALARTIVVEPRILLLDEPLSNLDANLRVQMRQDILALQRKLNLTTIFVTHDQEEANSISDRMALLSNGVVQQVGTPLALYDKPCNNFVASFLGTANIFSGEVQDDNGTKIFVTNKNVKIELPKIDTPIKSVVIRPQNINLSAVNDAAASKGGLIGVVTKTEFLGSHIRYEVIVDGELFIVDQHHHLNGEFFEKSSEVQLIINKDQTVILN
ncbi:MAG: ABC transporter ATP-binding protein [Rhizobiales bacterium]|nr:ABC transporter ATP-binding protein [Hyphomicrobiales bacterium]